MRYICGDNKTAEIECTQLTSAMGNVSDLEEFPAKFTALESYEVVPMTLYRIKDDNAPHYTENQNDWAYVSEDTLKKCFIKIEE